MIRGRIVCEDTRYNPLSMTTGASAFEWVVYCSGGWADGRRRGGFRTRKAARAWADEFGYEWREVR